MNKLPSQLTPDELNKALNDLLVFSEFSFFEERGVSQSLGITFAIEQLAASFGLVGDWLYEGNYDAAMMLRDFVAELDKKARELSCDKWLSLYPALPYSEAL